MKYKIMVMIAGIIVIAQIILCVAVIEMKGDVDGIGGKIWYIENKINGVEVVNGYAELGKYYPEDEIWWYKLQCALTDPKVINIDIANQDDVYTSFNIGELAYTKDYDDLCITEEDAKGSYYWLAGGLMRGGILTLQPGTYYHYGNSGIMYITQSNVDNIDYDPIERYYKRIRYVMETKPDIEIEFKGDKTLYQDIKELDIPPNGAVISFVTGGAGFVAANLYLRNEGDIEWRTMNGLGPGIYIPGIERFASSGNIYSTPLNMVPIPGGKYETGIHIVMNDIGKVYFRIHFIPDWW